MKFSSSLALFAALALAAKASAATIITNNGVTTSNVDIPQIFGDNITTGTTNFSVSSGVAGFVGTPNIGLTWASSGASGGNTGNWQHHIATGSLPAPSGGALQLDGGVTGSTFSVTFAPQAGFGVLLNSFNFTNDSAGSPTYNYTLNVVDVTASSTIFTQNIVFDKANITTANIALNTTGAIGNTLRLELVRTGGTGAGNDIYIDNLSFDQVPEPSVALLGGLGLLGLLRRRRA